MADTQQQLPAVPRKMGRPRKRPADETEAPSSSQNPQATTKKAKGGTGRTPKRSTRAATKAGTEPDGDEDMSSGDESDVIVEIEQVRLDDETPVQSQAAEAPGAGVRMDVKLDECLRAPQNSKEVHIYPELCQYVAGAQSYTQWKVRITRLMALVFIVNKNITPDQQRAIHFKTCPPAFYSDDALAGKCSRFIANQQRRNQEFYKKAICAYGQTFMETAAGKAWKEYISSSEYPYSTNLVMPDAGDVIRWTYGGQTYPGLELSLFSLVDMFRHVLPHLRTVPTPTSKDISWLKVDKDLNIAKTLLANAALDIHFYIINEVPVSGALSMTALQAAIDSRPLSIPQEKYPDVDMSQPEPSTEEFTTKFRIRYPFVQVNQRLTVDGIGHVYTPEALLTTPVKKRGTPQERYEAYGFGTDESPLTKCDSGPAPIRERERNPEDEESEWEYEDMEVWAQKPGVEAGRDDPLQHAHLENPDFNADISTDMKEEIEAAADTNYKELVQEMSDEAFSMLDERGATYEPVMIAQAMTAITSATSSGSDMPITEMARRWSCGTLRHKFALTIAAMENDIAIMRAFSSTLLNKARQYEENIKEIDEHLIDLQAKLDQNLEYLTGVRNKRNLLKLKRKEEAILLAKVRETEREAKDSVGQTYGFSINKSVSGGGSPGANPSSSVQRPPDKRTIVSDVIRKSGFGGGFGFGSPITMKPPSTPVSAQGGLVPGTNSVPNTPIRESPTTAARNTVATPPPPASSATSPVPTMLKK